MKDYVTVRTSSYTDLFHGMYRFLGNHSLYSGCMSTGVGDSKRSSVVPGCRSHEGSVRSDKSLPNGSVL